MIILFSATTITPFLLPALSIAAVAAALVFVFMVAILFFRQIRTSREYLHAERMRTLELGMPLEPPENVNVQAKFMHTAFWISFWIVIGVPSAAFFAASAISREIGANVGLAIVVWVGAALASIAAVVCATILMIYSRCGSQK
jgi:hypothetical protein